MGLCLGEIRKEFELADLGAEIPLDGLDILRVESSDKDSALTTLIFRDLETTILFIYKYANLS